MSRQTPQTPTAGAAIEPPPFSRSMTVDELLRRPDEPFVVEPTPEERAGLAQLLRIPAVLLLRGAFRVARQGPFVHVTGQVRGRVSQTCAACTICAPARRAIRTSCSSTYGSIRR